MKKEDIWKSPLTIRSRRELSRVQSREYTEVLR